MTGRENSSRPATREKSPKLHSTKSLFNRCDSARSMLPRSNLASAKNLASLDNLIYSVDEPLAKSTSLHNLHTLVNDDVNIEIMDPGSLKK